MLLASWPPALKPISQVTFGALEDKDEEGAVKSWIWQIFGLPLGQHAQGPENFHLSWFL